MAVSPFNSDTVFNEVLPVSEQPLVRGFIRKLSYILATCLAFSFTLSNLSYADVLIPVRFSESVKLELKSPNTTFNPAFSFNPESAIMAIAENEKSAKALSEKDREVYYMFAGESVRQTINRWAAVNEYKVIYQTDANFINAQDTTIYGKFLSPNGALEQLLRSLKNTSNPIKATVKSNHVILIQPDEYNTRLLMPTSNRGDN